MAESGCRWEIVVDRCWAVGRGRNPQRTEFELEMMHRTPRYNFGTAISMEHDDDSADIDFGIAFPDGVMPEPTPKPRARGG